MWERPQRRDDASPARTRDAKVPPTFSQTRHVPFLDRLLHKTRDLVVYFLEIDLRFCEVEIRITLAFFVKHDARRKWIRAPSVRRGKRRRHVWFVTLLA